MKDLLLPLLHLAVTAAKLCRPGGVRAVIAENLLLKQQLIVLRRSRQRAPNLRVGDRLLCGFGALFLSPGRIRKVAIGLRPSTLLTFHQALVRGKCRRLFSSSARPKKPGPKGPSESLIRAIVELKSRNPRFGCPRIARIISQTFGVDIDKNVVHRVLAKRYRPAPGGHDNRQRLDRGARRRQRPRHGRRHNRVLRYGHGTERDRRGAPKQNGTSVSTETTVERAGSHDQEDDADRPLSVEARSCSTKYSRTAHRPSKPLQKPREFRDESAHGPLRVERLGDPFAFLNLGVTGTRLYQRGTRQMVGVDSRRRTRRSA